LNKYADTAVSHSPQMDGHMANRFYPKYTHML